MAKASKKLTLQVSFHNVGACTVNEMLEQALNNHRDEIVVWLAKRNDINANTYEGGIDGWWGWGSVMMCELGIMVDIKITDKDDVTLVLG